MAKRKSTLLGLIVLTLVSAVGCAGSKRAPSSEMDAIHHRKVMDSLIHIDNAARSGGYN